MSRYSKVVFFVLICLFFWQCGNHKTGFTVTGELESPVTTNLKLMHLGQGSATTVDSVFIDNETYFELAGHNSYPSIYEIPLPDDRIYLIIHPGDNLKIDINNTLNQLSYYVEGSPDSRILQQIIQKQKRVLDTINAISIAYENAKNSDLNYDLVKHRYDSIYDALLQSHKKYTIGFIQENPKSLACIFALYQNFGRTNQPLFDKFDDLDIYNFVDSNLTDIYPETPAVKSLNADVTEMKEQIKHKNYSEKLIQAGTPAPEFEVTTLTDEIISLSDLEDNPVIYFLFAIWNDNSQQMAIELNNIYRKYKYLGLKVIGISFDLSPEKLDIFIESNTISYPVACDFNYWKSDYVTQFGVRAIPDIILLDNNHIIVDRNLSLDEINQTLEEWRKNRQF